MSTARQIYKMSVTEIIDHTENIRELVIRTGEPASFAFKAGQFVTLHVPQAEKPVLRAYSIASGEQQKDGFRLIFKFVPEGIASTYVWKLKVGDTLQFTGPFGRVLFKEPPTKQIIFLNTGSGVSQHLCCMLSKKDQYPDLRYRMLFGVRYESDIYYQKQLEELSRQFSDFKYEFVISRPTENWKGKKGYVQNFIDELDYKNIESTFYLCGNGSMIKDVKAKLESEQFDKTRIFSEAFD